VVRTLPLTRPASRCRILTHEGIHRKSSSFQDDRYLHQCCQVLRWSRVSQVNKGGKIAHDGITEQAIYNIVAEYAERLGFGKLAPHDLRRTCAKLAHKGGAALGQIQLSLGHASIQTTERYLGVEQDLTDAPCDHLGLRL